jgi:Mg2+ and Co2+ transporter CorA
MRYEQRLSRLEARCQPEPAYALMDALQRAFAAAVREKITRRLDGIEDTPEQAADHAALLAQWRAVCGPHDASGARARLAARLDRMAARQQRSQEAAP